MQVVGIIGLAICAAVVYGVLHDQVTARICIEYFTIGHPRLIDSDSPTVLGLFWGVVATWWVGLPLGIGLAFVSRFGRRPKLSCAMLVRPVCKLLFCMAVVAVISGASGFLLARFGIIELRGALGVMVPVDKHVAFLTDWWAHLGSYVSGTIGGIALCVLMWRRRDHAPIAERRG